MDDELLAKANAFACLECAAELLSEALAAFIEREHRFGGYYFIVGGLV
ncbi:hypothetical protein [Pandoraea communis]